MAGIDASGKDPLAGLFPILRQIRTRAGLTQQQIARATGAGGRHGHKLIARLEAGHVSNPSVKLVLDYLRACRATSQDLADFLDSFLGAPLAIPPRHRRGRRPKETVPALGLTPEVEDTSLLALRREAAWWRLRRVIEEILHQELTRLGAKPMTRERKAAAGYGCKVFRSLYRTRCSSPAMRERRLKRCREWATSKGLPDEVRDRVFEAMSAFFAGMDARGQLDLLPPADEARHLMLLKPRQRFVTDEALCHNEFVTRAYEQFLVREAARKPVIEAAMNMLRSTGLTPQKIGNYPGAITAFLTVAENTQPGSTARDQGLADVLRNHQQSYFDQALLHHLAELVMSLRDQRV
jgi:transcriptional regulator with XRE-family HTH domain